jgi:hypothetical protein
MTSNSEMSKEQQEALMAANLGGLKKKLNAESWSPHMENLMKMWGEKAAGLRWMHGHSAGKWKAISDRLTIYGIFVTTFASTAAIATANIEGDAKVPVTYAIGGIGMCAALIQSLKKFYNAEEKVAEHSAIAKQFGSFYRYMTLQMGMSREDRVPSDELSSWALKEYERMQQDAPPIGGDSISEFKKVFPNMENMPDVAEDEFDITVYGSALEIETRNNKDFADEV